MKSIVVTGASGALGQVLVPRLEQQGTHVTQVERKQLLSLVAWRELLERLDRDGAAPEGAVLVAGRWFGGKALHQEPDDETWQRTLEANLETARVALQALLPGMVARKRGSIVVVASRAAERPWESARASAYAAAKAGLMGLMKAAAAEVLADGVRLNAVLPSTLDTAANRASMPNADVTRWVAPESLCDVIEFLLSDAARDVSGAALPVYGRVGV